MATCLFTCFLPSFSLSTYLSIDSFIKNSWAMPFMVMTNSAGD